MMPVGRAELGGLSMPLQNRVNPLGELVANSARGMLMGNRGCLHDADKKIGRRRWTTQSWVTCALSFNGRQREIMAPQHYTELFFLDEATALSAGHRPCATCRRENHKRFIAAWLLGNDDPPDRKLLAPEINAVLHRERIMPVMNRSQAEVQDLPDAAMVTMDGSRTWVKWNGNFHEWSFDGYGGAVDAPSDRMVIVTPASTVRALRHGYVAEVHPTLSAS